MTHRILQLLVMAVLLVQVPTTAAVEILSARELTDHCKVLPSARESADGQYCIRYIQGFIDGAVATDARVMLNLESEYEREETYTERAMRTRAPSRHANERAAVYAEFCLGDPVSLAEVVQKVVSSLSKGNTLNSKLTAREAVYAALRTHYPCPKNPKG